LAQADRQSPGANASLAAGELEQAGNRPLIGIRLQVIQTDEFSQESTFRNAPRPLLSLQDRALYATWERVLPGTGHPCLLNGAKRRRRGDYRPGMTAAAEHSVYSPLADVESPSQSPRTRRRVENLPSWDKPAKPLPLQRVAYGEEVTPERLAMVDAAEQFLRARAESLPASRYPPGDLARIEVPADELQPLCEPATRQELARRAAPLGFQVRDH